MQFILDAAAFATPLSERGRRCVQIAKNHSDPLRPVRTDSNARFDPEKYRGRMFPWEPIKFQPALINYNRTWLILAAGLALIVTLLALFRTPLPSCWEISP